MEGLKIILVLGMLSCPNVQSKLDFPESVTSVDNIENLIQYEYKYKVDEGERSGPVMDRWERRLGDHVKGAYSVLQPDGAIRTVDYEVDGERGYRAVTRLTPPAIEYLSFKQLNQAESIFPSPTASPQELDGEWTLPPPAETQEKLVNYHSKPPYINNLDIKDHKAAASTNLATALLQKSHPLTPANYNVPLSKSLIYYKVPAGKIQPDVKLPEKFFNIDALLPSQSNWTHFKYKDGLTEVITSPEPSKSNSIKRNSRLVKRFKSMDEVYS